MREKIIETLDIPEGVSCSVENSTFSCKKGSVELSRSINVPGIKVSVSGNKVDFVCESGNKNDYKILRSNVVHIRNLFKGLDEQYVYNLESCNVHFPMTLKVEGSRLIINNFLGEKQPRFADIRPGVNVEIKGAKITVSSHNKEFAGQTAANIEKATKIRLRDRRVFQDGIYITGKAGAKQ